MEAAVLPISIRSQTYVHPSNALPSPPSVHSPANPLRATRWTTLPHFPAGLPGDTQRVPAPYRNLNWRGWNVANIGPESSYQATSKPNVAFLSLITNTNNPNKSMSIDYPGSRVTSFDMKSTLRVLQHQHVGKHESGKPIAPFRLRDIKPITRLYTRICITSPPLEVPSRQLYYTSPSSLNNLVSANWTIVAPFGSASIAAIDAAVDNVTVVTRGGC